MKVSLPKFSLPAKLKIASSDKTRGAIILGALILTLALYHWDILKRFEYVTYDYRCILRGDRAPDPRVVVIEISDDSVTKIGRWPWERSWHATLVKILEKLEARAVIFDVIFSEPSDPAKDAVFSQAIQESNRVYLAEVAETQGQAGETAMLKSLPEFSGHAKGGGHINLEADVDGVMRRISPIKLVARRRVPQLSLAVALDEFGTGLDEVTVRKNELIIPVKNALPVKVPLDASGNFIINWVGRWKGTFAHFSYFDVVSAYAASEKGESPLIDLGFFKGKFCYVGTSAAGLFDIRPTSLEPAYPAVGVNLTVLNNLLEKKFIKPLGQTENQLILVVIAFALFWILRISNFFRAAGFTAALAALYQGLVIGSFILFSVWVQLVYVLFLIFTAYFFVTLYNQLSVTIERAKLVKLATRDSLTGLYNIGHFKMLMAAELATLAIRRDRALSVIMGDVDNFKHTNDTYGHLTGDSVLREVASVVKSNCRTMDVPARYGGEEFILMLPGADAGEAFKVADKIRVLLNQKVFFNEKGDFKTSISIGVTEVSVEEKDLETIIARADRALYEAKQTGKNKVVIASDSPRRPSGTVS
ncbi:MAG: diguanylate cyclase [Candidatus Omnitrophica bacterium]|nr:diguanylate cyclase [Candidatus Omnitrophota bacterium]